MNVTKLGLSWTGEVGLLVLLVCCWCVQCGLVEEKSNPKLVADHTHKIPGLQVGCQVSLVHWTYGSTWKSFERTKEEENARAHLPALR